MGLHSIWVYTHDSIGVGEDGPTHQPVEQIASLRAIPGLTVLRPCDANETAVAWQVAVETRDRPTLLVLTRQHLPTLDRSRFASAEGVRRGAYVLTTRARRAALILIAHRLGGRAHRRRGRAARRRRRRGALVSMPSWELFERQPQSYRDEVLPRAVKARLAVELGVSRLGALGRRCDGDVVSRRSLRRFGAGDRCC